MVNMDMQKSDATRPYLPLRDVGRVLLSAPMVPVLLISAIAMSLMVPGFLGAANLRNMAWVFAPLLIAALGMTFVFLIGGIDLSIGSTLSLSTVVTALVMRETGAIWPGALAGIATGIAVGAVNGFTIAILRFPAFVHTFGMLLLLRAIAMLMTSGASVGRLPKEVLQLGRGSLFGLPNLLWIALVVLAFSIWLLSRSRIGREMYLMGSNERAALFNGLRVTWTKFAAYLLCGAFAGLAGVTVVLRLGSGGPVLGDNTLLMAIAAVVLGGTAITGGEGSAMKTASGVAVIVLLDKGLNMLGLSFYDQAIVLGIVIVLGSAFSAWLFNRLFIGRRG